MIYTNMVDRKPANVAAMPITEFLALPPLFDQSCVLGNLNNNVLPTLFIQFSFLTQGEILDLLIGFDA